MEYYKVTDGELKHYGVVGMKWGVRRARSKGSTYTYTSHGTKKYAKKANQYRKHGDIEKAKKYDNYHKRSVELDRKMQSNAERTSTGKAVAKTLLTAGNLGGRTYEAVKASAGGSKVISRGAAFAASILTGPLGASIARASYVRNDKIESAGNRIKSAGSSLKNKTVNAISNGASNTFASYYRIKEEGKKRAMQ